MGCVSSKHLKKQAHLEEHWETDPVKRKPSHRSSKNDVSLEEYHRHLVALTSSSYGLLKMDVPPKMPEGAKKSTSRLSSMNDMYDSLKVLESVESTPKSWDEVSSVLHTLQPGLERSTSMPVPRSNKTRVQETINVADIMQGLEEEASDSSSPSHAVAVSCNKPQPPPPPPPPGLLIAKRHKKFDKSTHTTTQGLEGPQTNADAVATQKLPRLPSEDVSRISPHETGSRHTMHVRGRLTENVKPLNAQHLPFFIQKSLARGSVAQCQNEQDQHVSTENAMAANESKKTVVEDRSVCRDNEVGPNPYVPSNITYLTASRRRLKLTLNLEYENTFFTGTQGSQDACSPAGSSARRSLVDVLTEPDSPLFDPALLASYEKALMELRKEDWSIVNDSDELPDRTRFSKEYDMHIEETPAVQVPEEALSDFGEPSNDDATNTNSKSQSYEPLDEFEWKCPPGGEESIVLYTTTLRGIRKTFEDCNHVRETLQSFSVGIDERDVSMHLTFRNELKGLMGGAVSVPRIFIKGRYIGGVDDISKLHESNKLSDLLKDLPKKLNSEICDGCGGVRFVPCLECSGSCKIIKEDNSVSRCPECNENGLIQCPICS